MPSPGNPKITSTSHSISLSIRVSATSFAIRSCLVLVFRDFVANFPRRSAPQKPRLGASVLQLYDYGRRTCLKKILSFVSNGLLNPRVSAELPCLSKLPDL